jgi:hypothetical protein
LPFIQDPAQQQLQRPAVAQPLAQAAVTVGVGIDQARHDQPPGVDRLRRRGTARRHDGGNAVAVEHDVGRTGAAVDQDEATGDDKTICLHGEIPLRCLRQVNRRWARRMTFRPLTPNTFKVWQGQSQPVHPHQMRAQTCINARIADNLIVVISL